MSLDAGLKDGTPIAAEDIPLLENIVRGGLGGPEAVPKELLANVIYSRPRRLNWL